MDAFSILYTLLGGIGFFFFGMKMMSDALQQAASDVITKIINSLTTNRYMAVVVGIIVTMIVQSSSVTTVMVVGFVNAGLMQLTQAIGVILGANIGTTVTGWIISIKVGKYGLLLVALGVFPALFSKNQKLQNIGRVLFGVGMIFIGLETMSEAFKPLRSNQTFLDMIAYFSSNDYFGYFASIITGCLLTMVIQSSSAMLGITIALGTTGAIDFNTAAALIMGENIGTTITALLASVGTSANAKRAARAHALFNTLSVVLMFPFLPYYIDLIEWLIPGQADLVTATGDKPNIAAHIAASHTGFNVLALIIFFPFMGQLAKIVTYITPTRGDEERAPQLILIGDPSEIVPATAIPQAQSETKKMKSILDRMFLATKEYLTASQNDQKVFAKISNYEQITDNIQKEVTLFLVKVMEKPLSTDQSKQTQAFIKIVDEYESIADYLNRLARYRSRFKSDPHAGISHDTMLKFMDEVWEFFQLCSAPVMNNQVQNMSYINRKSEELRIWADDLRDKHFDRVSKGEYEAVSAVTYSDMVVCLRKVRAHSLNIAEASVALSSKDF